MRSDPNSASTPSRYNGLQALRLLAAVMVLITHSTLYAHERLDQKFTVWGNGATGVEIFFVLSGFVMMHTSASLATKPRGYRIFAERRILRIVPIYWIATTVKLLALLCASGYVLHTQLRVKQLIASYLFLPARGSEGDITPVVAVGWTLNFEMFFYALFALALFLRVSVFKLAAPILLALALGAFFRQPDWPAVSFYLDTRVLLFLYGMTIAALCHVRKYLGSRTAITALTVGFLVMLGPWKEPTQLHGLPTGFAAFLILYGTASLEKVFERTPRFILFGADASYAIYLFHPFIAPVVPVVLSRLHWIYPWLSVLISTVLAIAGGCAIHLWIEAPLLQWLRGRIKNRGQRINHPAVA